MALFMKKSFEGAVLTRKILEGEVPLTSRGALRALTCFISTHDLSQKSAIFRIMP
jgi:hypothetical protein